MLTCEFHGCTYPEGYTCPACQRTDGNIMTIWRELRELKKSFDKFVRELPPYNWEAK